MAISRYSFTTKLENGKFYGTWSGGNKIYFAVQNGAIQYKTITLKEGIRLDHFAGSIYGDGSLWWIIAAASGIGWGLQVPPGTLLKIPTNLGVAMVVGK